MTYGVNVDALRTSYKRLRDVGRRDRFEAPGAWLGRAQGVIADAKTPEQIEAEQRTPLPRYVIPGCGCGCNTEHGIYPKKENPQQPGD